jgi:ATP-dependent helicase/nuclease subunit B
VAPLEANPLNRPQSELLAAAVHCLGRGGIVVTGNARAARALRQSHAAAQRASGRLAWPTPLIHDWESWLSILWQQRLQNIPDAPLLLTPLQERAIWKKISAGAASDSEAIAKLAIKAWELLSDFNAQGERNRSWGAVANIDSEIFRGWASTFDRQCKSNRWLSRSDLTALLAQSIGQGAVELPREILLVGLDRVTPAQQTLIDAARTAGTFVQETQAPPKTGSVRLLQANELRDELSTCASWLRRKIEANPSASIAVIVQGAEEMRGEIHRIFRAILMPESAGIEHSEAMPFEFSLGLPLATVPLVKAALLALRWLVEPLEQPSVSWLTTSGFLAATGEDILEMAEFDAELRKHSRLPPTTSLDAFVRYSPRTNSLTVRRSQSRFRAFQTEAGSEGVSNRKRTFPEWVAVAEGLLRPLQWPGGRTLESVEFQALARWERLLGEVAALGFEGARVSWVEFVTVLDRYAAETIFAPESRGAPIQIMGPLESAGQSFDSLWFLGVDDRHWPATGQPSPLLPLWLQRKAEMPRASMSDDWTLHLAITQRLAFSGADCVFSHALRDETGELRTSALLREALGSPLRTSSSEELRLALQVPAVSPHRRRTVPIEDASSIPWPNELPAGGAEILKRQSACAFQSFAMRRLDAEELEAPERGLSPLDRGNIVHDVMNSFWSMPGPDGVPLKSQSDLFNAKVHGHLPEILDFHIAKVFRKRRDSDQESNWSKAYLQVEQARLRSLLLHWLDYEGERTDFTVEACEKESETEINGLQLRLRVDRIDQVNGGRLILDYKTGKVTPALWRSDRPDEPQLPLYAIHGRVDNLRGVLFAEVRAGEAYLIGRAEDPRMTIQKELAGNSGLLKNQLNEGVLSEWRNALDNLAGGFLDGDAAVAPKLYPITCRYCALASLCRVAETIVPIEAAANSIAGEDDAVEEESFDE